jgi:heme o synthase
MGTEPIAIPAPAQEQLCNRSITRAVTGYWALTKPDVNFLITITVFVGFSLARSATSQSFPYVLLIHTLLGTLMVASGTGTLNQVIERKFDAQMRRTARRPLVLGRVSRISALWFGIFLAVGGTVYLATAVNRLSSFIAALTLVSYLAVYTPLKRKSWYCMLVGAFPGAAPPLIGWAAASGRLNSEAWSLYFILFLWQFPHFMAIAWMYREDYDRAGYVILPRGAGRSRLMAWQCILPACLLILLSLLPSLLGKAGLLYSVGALLLGASFLYSGMRMVLCKSNMAARRLLTASIIYLPSIFVLMLLSRR